VSWEWTSPWAALLALLALPVWLWSRRAPGRVVFSAVRLLPAGGSWRTAVAWVPDLLAALAIVALAVALAGPRRGQDDARLRTEGIAIAMVLDTSSSMAALDLSEGDAERTRLDAVKAVFERFVLGDPADPRDGRPDDLVGLVGFARYADTRAPLTLDHPNLVAAARALTLVPPRSRDDGTAIGDGLALAVERLAASPAASKVAIVLTDGEDNASRITPDEAAAFATRAGVKVYTIGAGTTGTAPMRLTDPDTGASELVQVPVRIDEELLRSVAEATGGRYFRADDAEALRRIYGEIDALEKTDLEQDVRFLEYDEFFDRFVAVGLALAVLALLLRATVLRRLP
jgi:Ca-activated chloride channel family protein